MQLGLQPLSPRIPVVGLVRDQPPHALAWPAPSPARHLYLLQGLFDPSPFRRRGRSQCASQRNPLAVAPHPLRSLAALGFSDTGSPFFAGAKLPSAKVSSKFRYGRSSGSAGKARQTSSQTPNSSQSFSRRQQVEALGYRRGRSRQRAPLWSTPRMPSKTCRLSCQALPSLGTAAVLGKSGYSFFHCSSFGNGVVGAIGSPPTAYYPKSCKKPTDLTYGICDILRRHSRCNTTQQVMKPILIFPHLHKVQNEVFVYRQEVTHRDLFPRFAGELFRTNQNGPFPSQTFAMKQGADFIRSELIRPMPRRSTYKVVKGIAVRILAGIPKRIDARPIREQKIQRAIVADFLQRIFQAIRNGIPVHAPVVGEEPLPILKGMTVLLAGFPRCGLAHMGDKNSRPTFCRSSPKSLTGVCRTMLLDHFGLSLFVLADTPSVPVVPAHSSECARSFEKGKFQVHRLIRNDSQKSAHGCFTSASRVC